MNEDRPISERLGLHVNQDVIANGIPGVIHGFMNNPDRVIVSHWPKDMPVEIIPEGEHHTVKLHYDPKDVKPITEVRMK
jgi:hypothetical protein